MRVGILSGGGDSPGINAVIRAVVRTAANVAGHECVGIRDGFEGLLDPPQVVPLGLREIGGTLARGGTILGASNRCNPFDCLPEGGGGGGAPGPRVDRSAEVARNVRELGLHALVVIGGDGTMAIAQRLAERHGVRLVGVPKTIDNDLAATSVTFGFDTAVATATDAIDKLRTTAESHHRVMYLELMGRDAGWIALEAGIAGGAHVVLIPEVPFAVEHVVAKIRDREREGKRYTIVVVSEGAREAGGGAVYLDAAPRVGAKRLGGVAEQVARKVAAIDDREYRVTVLGHVQRGGVPSARDRILASRFGAAAMLAVARGESGKMVALDGDRMALVPLEAAIGKLKQVDPAGELVATARAIVGDAPTLREAARRLVRWVSSTLQKESPAVADATAL
ncbi:MAG TPA: ATP-dependent 6-phosphofructokinase, partial [Planctomycetota bacterium]|nr:ATP-dependent 6-phosphofructokinase [Planctomycetota bacterium]